MIGSFRQRALFRGLASTVRNPRWDPSAPLDWRLKRESVSILPYKRPGSDIKKNYRFVVLGGYVVALLALVALFRAPLQSAGGFEIALESQEIVQIEEIRQTRQERRPPPPPRPPVPVEVPNEELLTEVELDLDATLDINQPLAMVPPPAAPQAAAAEEAPEEDEHEIFVAVEEMPEIIGGLAALYRNLTYPEMARKASLEGLVVVQVIIEPDGSPSNPRVVRSPGVVLDEAAVAAVMQLRFVPGKQRGRAVRVSYALPVRFQLNA
jgi:periplasmic protein TonB